MIPLISIVAVIWTLSVPSSLIEPGKAMEKGEKYSSAVQITTTTILGGGGSGRMGFLEYLTAVRQ